MLNTSFCDDFPSPRLLQFSSVLVTFQSINAVVVWELQETDSETEFSIQGVSQGVSLGLTPEAERGRNRAGRGKSQLGSGSPSTASPNPMGSPGAESPVSQNVQGSYPHLSGVTSCQQLSAANGVRAHSQRLSARSTPTAGAEPFPEGASEQCLSVPTANASTECIPH